MTAIRIALWSLAAMALAFYALIFSTDEEPEPPPAPPPHVTGTR